MTISLKAKTQTKPTWPIDHASADSNSWPIPVGQFLVETADSAIESSDSTIDSAGDPVKIGLWVWAFSISILHYSVFIQTDHLVLQIIPPPCI